MDFNTDEKIEIVQNTISEWGKSHFRRYPWRFSVDPYELMIAEFMLHRTRADQVLPVYTAFIERYPDIFSLARADPAAIQELTEHLGLHWRARHFTNAAKYVVEKYHGLFPKRIEELRSIPGFGEYITGAIYIVCYGKPYPVVDSNIARLISRIFGIKTTGELRRNKEILIFAGKLFNIGSPAMLLFSILDFTSEICVAGNPHHEDCPINEICSYYLGLRG